MTELRIPEIGPDVDTCGAALKYAADGWYVVPISRRDRKNAGSVLGKGWPAKSTRDPETIVALFAGTDYLVGLHCGRSGAWVPDVDHPDAIPPVLADAIKRRNPPHQSSRPDQPGRGHYPFLQPTGRMIGNATGDLGKAWGEGRGKNGIIVVAPSTHKDEDHGAFYQWLTTGPVPAMTDELAAALPDAGDTSDAATDAEVDRFIAEHTESRRPAAIKGPLKRFEDRLAEGVSRHEAMLEVCCWAAREAMVGLYAAKPAFDTLTARFIRAMAEPRKPTDRRLTAKSARAEAHGSIAWAVAQAELLGADKIRERMKDAEPPDPRAALTGEESAGSAGSEDFEYRFLGGQLPPIPLPGRTHPLPLPKSCPALTEFVVEVADALQVPTDMPLTMALPVLAAASGGHWEVQVRPGWLEPLSICALVCQGSGERKSPALSEVERPVKAFQAEARHTAMPTYRTRETKAALAKKRYETAMGKAGKNEDLEAESETIRLYEAWQTAQEALTPLPAWLIGADGTPEAFVDQLIKHRALGIVSSEPGLFGALGGRYSSGNPNIEWFLAATSGERLDPHRIGRDSGSVERPVLSALSCIQPGRIRELGKVKPFRDSGLLARHLFSMSDTMLGRRQRPREVSTTVRARWTKHISDLLKASNKINLGSTKTDDLKVIRCTEAAAELLARFDDELEPELIPHTGRYCDIGDWIAKAVGTAARLAGVLALVNDPAAAEIGTGEVGDAIAIMRAYISHTMAAFALTDPASDLFGHAAEVLTVARDTCAKEDRQWFTRREVHQRIRRRTWAQSADALEGPFSVLMSHGFIVKPEAETKPGPGRPADRYLLNPAEPVSRETAAPPRTPRNTASKSSELSSSSGDSSDSSTENPSGASSESCDARPTFSEWLAQHRDTAGPIGNLSRDVTANESFPVDSRRWDEVEGYLCEVGAENAVIDAAYDAYGQYRQETDARSKPVKESA